MTETKRKPSIKLTRNLVEAIILAGYEIGIESAEAMISRGWAGIGQIKAERDEEIRVIVDRVMKGLEPLY